jgi:hypothetical protein
MYRRSSGKAKLPPSRGLCKQTGRQAVSGKSPAATTFDGTLVRRSTPRAPRHFGSLAATGHLEDPSLNAAAPRRCAVSCMFVLVALALGPAARLALAGDVSVLADRTYDMSVLPDDAPTSPWARVGSGPAFLMPDQTLIINDNSIAETIAFQTLLGRIEADHAVSLTGRVKVLANSNGDAATMEVARPGLEAVLRLYTDRVDLLERKASGGYRWMGTAPVDLSVYRTVTLRKKSRREDPYETLVVEIDGQVVLTARPQALGGLDVGRLLVGSLSYVAVGASLWDWIRYRLESVAADVAADPVSMGSLKAAYGVARAP